MNENKVSVPALKAGDIVGIANCASLGKIVARIQKNLYSVEWKGSLLRLPRNQILVNHNGRFVRY